MQRIYDKYKNRKVTYSSYSGLVCGYTENRLIIATESSPLCSFRRLDKGKVYISEKYKDSKYRYTYADEKDVDVFKK